MKFGYFDNKKKEYVIETPRTPYPWINYLGAEAFFSLISNTGGGYSFYRDARLRRITRYKYNSAPADDGGKYFYINDNGDVWSPGWKPVKAELEAYECRHGMGYTKISGKRNGVQAEVLAFVPMNTNCEVQKVTVTNDTDAKKEIKLFSYAEFNLWNAMDDMTNFQRNFSTGEVEIVASTIFHKTEYRERRNHYAFYSTNVPVAGYDTDRESFLGLYNGYDSPEVVLAGKSKNTEAHGWSPIASHCVDLTLEAGETKEVIFILGYIENPDDQKWEAKGVINKTPAWEMIAKFDTTEKVASALNEIDAYWDELLSGFQTETGVEGVDTMANIWNQYQCMVTFNMSRSASFFESGIGRGMGFRDSNQDVIGVVHQVPDRVRERILDIAATQLEDGGAYHQYQPLTKRGNDEIGGNFNDDPLWLILSVTSYIKETGDFSILKEQVPFDNDESKAKSLLEHLKRAFHKVGDNLGPNKLPLIGRADWNDCLNLNCFSTTPDEPFQTTENQSEGSKAESVMIAGMFVLYGKEFSKLCRQINENDIATKIDAEVNLMIEAINEKGWDGDWFLRAYDFYGEKIGSKENEEGKIFIESQGFCIMAGVGIDDGRAAKALDSVKEHLDCDYGIVLNQPPYTKYHVNLGEISTYPAGYKENAGIFCHNNPWIIIAETMLGNGDRAFDYYKKISPAFLQEISDLHKTEPYIYSQMIAGKDAYKPGEAKNSWLTGTAAWNFYTISQYILGIQADYNGLSIKPCIPKDWKQYNVNRTFRGKKYNISVKNPNNISTGVKQLTVNGQQIEGNLIPFSLEGDKFEVEVIMG